MSTLEDLDDIEREEKEQKKEQDGSDKKKGGSDSKDGKSGDTDMKDADKEEDDIIDAEILSLSTRDIVARRRLLENDLRVMKSEFQRLTHEKATMNEKLKDNLDKIENNRLVLYIDGLTFARLLS